MKLALIAALIMLSAPITNADSEFTPMPTPTPRQLGMTGAFAVKAQNGLIRFKALRGGRWAKTEILASGMTLERKISDVRASGEPMIDLSGFDMISASHRVESMRLLDGTSWSALAMIVALHLDDALARGTYRYLLVSDDTHHVLLEISAHDRIRMKTYVRIPGESQPSFIQHRHLNGRLGYAFVVPELTKTRAGADFLLERLENIGVARSALLERIIASRA
jgi:hypothetical protein